MVSIQVGSIPAPRAGATIGVARDWRCARWHIRTKRLLGVRRSCRCAEGVAVDKDFPRWNSGARRLVGKRVRRATRAALRGMRGDAAAWDSYTDARSTDYRRDWDFYAAL